jgi:hypothetical protein
MGLPDAHISGFGRGRRAEVRLPDPASPAAETQRRSRENSKREIEALEEIEEFIVTLWGLVVTRHLHAAAPHQNAHDLLCLS